MPTSSRGERISMTRAGPVCVTVSILCLLGCLGVAWCFVGEHHSANISFVKTWRHERHLFDARCVRDHHIFRHWGQVVASLDPQESLIFEHRKPYAAASWLRPVYQEARRDLARCWAKSGRVWQVDVMRPGRFVAGLSVCVPWNCSRNLSLSTALPKAFPVAWRHGGHIALRELADFAGLRLDFALVGADSCGTHSLQENLDLHPNLTLNYKFDHTWFRTKTHPFELFPTRSAVQAFNVEVDRQLRKQLTKRRNRGELRIGISDAGLSNIGLALERLGQVPNVRVIIIVCDPVGRFEKNLWWSPFAASGGQVDTMFEISDKMHLAKQATHRLGPRLPVMRDIFGDRLKIVHRDALKMDPRKFYNTLASFIGVPPFGEEAKFSRYNSRQGRRSDLCDNNASVALAALFETDYVLIEEALLETGEMVPASLRLRRTRCQDAAEMNESGLRCIATADNVGKCDEQLLQ